MFAKSNKNVQLISIFYCQGREGPRGETGLPGVQGEKVNQSKHLELKSVFSEL